LNGTSGWVTQTVGVTLTVQAAKQLHPQIGISPGSGTLGVTGFTKTGSGFTPNSTVTQNLIYPNGGLTTFTTAADASGNYTSSGLVYSSQTGNYSETDTDASGAKSNTITWTITAPVSPHIGISPGSGTLSVTSFTKTGSGFTPNSTVTQNLVYPNGGLTTFTATADASGNYTASGLVYSSQTGNYSETDTDATGAKSNTITWTITAPVSPHIGISPGSGTLGVTSFTKTGSGFTPNSTVTQNLIYPNGGPTTFTVTADASGNYTASGLVYSSQTGTYSETDTDTSGAKSNTITWTITAPVSPHIGISPGSGTLGVTSFTKTGSGFTPNSTVTQNLIYPNGGLTTFTAAADASGNYTASGLVYSSQTGNYSETDTDASGAKSNTITWTIH
jgi:fatty acid-binding protein DegV